mgnify:FL=1
MSSIINLPTFSDDRGNLTVIENSIGFDIKRVYYIYNTDSQDRGGHRHKKTIQVLICLNGSCEVLCENENTTDTYILDSPSKALIVEPQDWHVMKNFSKDSILLVLASENYDKDDYIDERYI